MKLIKICFLTSTIAVSSSFGATQQRATATWHTSAAPKETDGHIRTVIRMNVDEGWHTYWKNPGEAGLPLSIKANLPEGWSVGEILYPVPKRFMTGELPGFGYEGEVIFPLKLKVPEDFSGEIPPLTATLKWLTCNDETCLPGKTDLELAPGADDELIEKAYATLPRAIPGSKLSIIEAEDFIQLSLLLPGDSEIDLSGFDVLPATPDVIDPGAKPSFRENPTTPNTWIATAPKSGYLSEIPDEFVLVLKGPEQISYEVSTK